MSVTPTVVLVTGAASGIGRATASALASETVQLVITDINSARLEDLSAEIRRAGHDVTAVSADLTSRAEIDQLVEIVTLRFGRLDVLCNIAGVLDRALLAHEVTDEIWSQVLAVNLTAPFQLCRAWIPVMLEQEAGVIINVTSVAGVRGGRAGTAYTVAKHGLIGLTKSIGVAYGARGLRSVAICPGALTVRTADLSGDRSALGSELVDRAARTRPAEGTPEGIAHLIRFAISDQASHLNATTIVADGGWTAL